MKRKFSKAMALFLVVLMLSSMVIMLPLGVQAAEIIIRNDDFSTGFTNDSAPVNGIGGFSVYPNAPLTATYDSTILNEQGNVAHAIKLHQPDSTARNWGSFMLKGIAGNPPILPESAIRYVYKARLKNDNFYYMDYGPFRLYPTGSQRLDIVDGGTLITGKSYTNLWAAGNPWFEFMAVFNLETSEASAYINGTFVGSHTFTDGRYARDKIFTYSPRWSGWTGASIGSFYWDDIKIFVPDTLNLSSSTPSSSAINVDVTSPITLNFNNPIKDASNITVTGTDVTAQPVITNRTVNGNSCTLTFESDLEYSKQYSVDLSGALDVYAQSPSTSSITFTTEAQPEFSITTPVFKKLNLSSGTRDTITTLSPGLIVASTTVENTGVSSNDITLITVLKKDGVVSNITFNEKTMAVGDTLTMSAGFDVPNDGSNYSIEVYSWNTIEGMRPRTQKYLFDSTGGSFQ